MTVLELVKACFQDMILKDGYMWFFDNRIQALCRMKDESFKIEIIATYKKGKKFYVRRIFKFQNKFYFASRDSARLLVYNDNAEKDELKFYLQESFLKASGKVYTAFKYDTCIYFLPVSMDVKMVCFDMYTERYSEMLLCDSSMKEVIGNSQLDIGYPCFYGNAIWFPIQRTPFYVKYSLAERKAELFQETDKEIMLSGICFDGKNIWLTQEEIGDVICVGKRTINISAELPYSWLHNIGNYIIVSMLFSNKILLIDRETLEVSMRDLSLDEKKKQCGKGYSIINCCESNDVVFLLRSEIQDLIIFDKKTLEVRKVKLKCENYIENFFRGKEKFVEEQEDINLECLIRLSGQEIDMTADWENERDSGKTIWKHVRRRL